MILETKRLILRPWEMRDAKALYRYAKDPQVGPSAGWPVHKSVADSAEIIYEILSAPETYAVVLKERAEEGPVGSVGIMRKGAGVFHAPMKDDEAEIGYWIGVPFWGKGLIPEAVQALLNHCFADLSCSAVWCGYYEGNERSRRVQEKCGFLFDHAEENKQTPLGDCRTEYFSKITKEQGLAFSAKSVV